MDDHVFSYLNPNPAAAGDGPLAGCRLAIQPNLSVRGWPASAGSRALEHYVALEDATVVKCLTDAGAHIAGATRMGELAFGLDGDTSAAAVASAHCDAALVTDTLGEARVAAAGARLVGFKPTAGIISRYGLIGLIPSMECLGFVARDLAVIRGLLRVTAGPDARDFSLGTEFPNLTRPAAAVSAVAVIPHSLAGLDPAEREAFTAALTGLQSAGISTREAPLEQYELFRAVHQAVGATEASSSAGKYDGVRYGHRASKAVNWNDMYLKSREESFGPLVKAFLFQGAHFQFNDYPTFENACRLRRRLVGALEAVLREAKMIALPTRRAAVAERPAAVTQVYDRFALTLAANVAGLPAISLPGFVIAGADDLGLQLIGRRLEDAALLDCAAGLLATHGG